MSARQITVSFSLNRVRPSSIAAASECKGGRETSLRITRPQIAAPGDGGALLLKCLSCLALTLGLFGTRVPAAPAESSGTEKARAIVPIFRLDGPLSEVPEGDASQLFSVPGTSLKELVGRLAEAATDPAVKAVVLLPEG